MSRLPRIITGALLVALTLNLSGCFTLAATGLAVGTMAAIDRRTIGAQTEDQAIELKASAAVSRRVADAGGVSVTSFNRRVLLTGQVASQAERDAAAEAVRTIDNVASVHNELVVSGRVGLGVTASDTAITAKVKTALLRADGVPANSIKVVTEASVVYLLGLVTPAESQMAGGIASRVGGVTKVVLLFEPLTAEQAATIDGQRNAAKN
ncbi:MAG: BON domain-containing protein [Burkholderiaceae bacterium]|nr:BON domain-containing protein [Burkholderiaceae bacterium]